MQNKNMLVYLHFTYATYKHCCHHGAQNNLIKTVNCLLTQCFL